MDIVEGRRLKRAREQDGDCENQRQLNVDRISDLQDELAHHILSFLPTEDVTRIGALSSRWNSIWKSFPSIDFDESRFRHLGFHRCREKFHHSMKIFLRRGIDGLPFIQKIRVFAIHPLDNGLLGFLDICMLLSAWKSKLLELDITIDDDNCSIYENSTRIAYNLPNSVFTYGRYLTSLILKACSCGPFLEIMKLPSLKKVSLTYVLIPDEMLQNLITNSPNLEDLNIEHCFNMVSLRVFNSNLRRLAVASRGDLMLLEMEVPNLCYFSYHGILNSHGENVVENSQIVQFSSSPNRSTHFESLKTVVLSHVRMDDRTFKSMLRSFQFLESLTLHFCTIGSMPFDICPRLENVEMENCRYNMLLFNKEKLRNFSVECYSIERTFKELSVLPLSKLTKISLVGNIHFENGSLDLTSGTCLETVILSTCFFLRNITIAGNSMKSLTLESCFSFENVSIRTPNLKHFSYEGFVMGFSELVIHDDAVVKLRLMKKPAYFFNALDHYDHILWNFYRMFQYNRFVSIECYEDQSTIIVPSTIGLNPSFRFVEEFNVEAVFTGMTHLAFLLELLNQAFCYRTLCSNMVESTSLKLKFYVPPNMAEIASCRDQVIVHRHDCVQRHLIKADIENFEGDASDMDLVAYLLKTATSLETMTIGFSEELSSDTISAIATMILTFPCAHPGLEIKLG